MFHSVAEQGSCSELWRKKKKSSLAQFVRLLGKHEGIFQYKLSCWSLFFSGPESCEVLTVIIPSTSQRKL